MQRETITLQFQRQFLCYFNPLPLCRGRRYTLNATAAMLDFNPLPLCRGRLSSVSDLSVLPHFNPLPLCRGRHGITGAFEGYQPFQSSPSMQRETFSPVFQCVLILFQSSPSMQRETVNSKALQKGDVLFQSSPSMQRETRKRVQHIRCIDFYFNPLPLCRGRLFRLILIQFKRGISILSLYAEGDPTVN